MTVAQTQWPKLTFGIIVLNGEPFTRYNLMALYPHAHQIIVVEGATEAGREIATPDGHSRDGTLATLRTLKAEEDPEGKIIIVTAELEGHPDGFWPGEKHEQSQAYARRATGDYLWQVDIDEFYMDHDVAAVKSMLRQNPAISALSFKQITFWGGLDYWVDGWYLRRGATFYHRLFKWDAGFEYVTHRPPTVLDEHGRDLRSLHWIDGTATAKRGIRLYHYSLLLPKQVFEKCSYYRNAEWASRSGASEWAEHAWLALERPYRVHNVYDHPSWLERYHGAHPVAIEQMMGRLQSGDTTVELRPTADIERLLSSPRYRSGRAILKMVDPIEAAWKKRDRLIARMWNKVRRLCRWLGRRWRAST